MESITYQEIVARGAEQRQWDRQNEAPVTAAFTRTIDCFREMAAEDLRYDAADGRTRTMMQWCDHDDLQKIGPSGRSRVARAVARELRAKGFTVTIKRTAVNLMICYDLYTSWN